MRPLNSCNSEFFVLSPTTFYRMYYHPDRIVHRWQSLCHRLRSTCEYLSLETLLLEDGFYVFLPSFDLLLPCVQRPLTKISNRPEVEKKSDSYCAIYKLCRSSTAEKWPIREVLLSNCGRQRAVSKNHVTFSVKHIGNWNCEPSLLSNLSLAVRKFIRCCHLLSRDIIYFI